MPRGPSLSPADSKVIGYGHTPFTRPVFMRPPRLHPAFATNMQVSFTMGEGRACRNVTVRTFIGDDTLEQQLCLVDGEHEYDHTITGNHSVEVVGFAESGLHEGAGGTTSFVVGM